jgi:hypothetical protein
MSDANDASLGTAICRLLERELRPILKRLDAIETRITKLENRNRLFSLFRRKEQK